jgi:Ca-activated chloride channel family protein
MKNLISNIRPTDKFNVMLFAGSASVLSEQSVLATKENLDKALTWVDNQEGSGGTELLPALQKALAIEKARGFSRTFVIATDGYVSIEKESFDLIRDNLGKANFFAFGIGSSVNRYLVEGIACAGRGESFIVTDPSECDAKAEKFRNYVQSPVLTDVKIDFGGFDVYDVEPLNIPDVLAERPVIIFGKWKGDPKGTIKVTGVTGNSDFNWSLDVASVIPSDKNVALKYLWAREKIRLLDDIGTADEKTIKEVTELGLTYNLLTQYTSFIAVDSLIRNEGGQQTTVKQPLPLPQGVSDYAVGGYTSASNGQGYGNAPTSAMKVCEKKVDAEDLSIEVNENVEVAAYYSGGEPAMQLFIMANLIMPEAARTAGISGKVVISFTIEANGDITNVKVVKGLGYGCNEEAIRLVKLMKGKWIPKEVNGTFVKSTEKIEVKF